MMRRMKKPDQVTCRTLHGEKRVNNIVYRATWRKKVNPIRDDGTRASDRHPLGSVVSLRTVSLSSWRGMMKFQTNMMKSHSWHCCRSRSKPPLYLDGIPYCHFSFIINIYGSIINQFVCVYLCTCVRVFLFVMSAFNPASGLDEYPHHTAWWICFFLPPTPTTSPRSLPQLAGKKVSHQEHASAEI